jgi:hypothetical protein
LQLYNPHKKQQYLRSQEDARASAGDPVYAENIGSIKISGPTHCIGDFSPRAGLWQLSECVYLPPAAGFVCGKAAFGLPSMQEADCVL